MVKKKALILGAGISGLSLAWYLAKNSDSWEIVILEKSDRAGGWMRSESIKGFFFERGPHTFSSARSQLLRQIATEAGLESEIIASNDSAKRRFLYLKNALRSCPKWPLVKALWHEWRTPPKRGEDESVYEFASRRFSREVAEKLFDPMTLGVYAGDMHKLSVLSCFPFFKKLEEAHGSVTKGMLSRLFQKKQDSSSALFSFSRGAESVAEALVRPFSEQIHYGQEARQLCFTEKGVEVKTQEQRFAADHLFCALPPDQTRALFAPHDKRVAELLQIPSQRLSIVNLGYARAVLPLKGFGYLVPTSEQEEILGVLFDSEIFPQQNTHPQETRLSVMMHSRPDCEEVAMKALKRHLKISATPEALLSTEAAIPQCIVGHSEKVRIMRERMAELFPRCTLVGNYLEGVSVNECLALSKKTAERFLWSAKA